MREFICISTVGYSANFPQYQNAVIANDACWGKIINVTGEHNVVYTDNKTACILNIPSDVRAGLIQQLGDEFAESPIDCHVNFENLETENSITGYVMLALMFFSILCLVATVFVYAVKKELLTVPGLNLTCLCLSHLVHYVTGICNLVNLPAHTVSHWECAVFGFTRHFSILATFLWLNVMAFDIWRTITSVSNGSRNGYKVFKWKRFAKYSLYAWGTSMSIALTAVIVDNVEGIPENLKPSYRPPNVTYPDLRCTMSINNLEGFLIFNTLPRIVVLIFNIAFFILTARAIHETSKQAEAIRSTNRVKARFRLYIKLFIVMGLAWILNIIDYAIHVRLGSDWVHSGPRWFNVFTTYVTVLIGVFIYITFALVPSIKLIRNICCSKVKVRPHSQLTVTESLATSRNSQNKEPQTVTTKL